MSIDPRQIAIALAGFSAFLNLYAPQSVLPLLTQEFATGAAQVSMTITASTAAVALVAPFAGAVADVLGRKRVIAAAMLALTIPTIGGAFAPDLQSLIAWRFVQGLCLPPIFAITIAYVGEEWPPAEATGVIGVYASAAGFGGFFGRFLTGVLADGVGWRSAFLADAALTLACAIGVILLLPRERRFVRTASVGTALTQMLRHLGNPALLGTFAVGFGVLFNFVAAFTYVNFLLAAPPFDLTPAMLGSLFVTYLLGSAVTPLTGRGVARFGRKRLVLAVLAVWAAGIVLTLLASLPAIVAGLALSAACGFLCQSTSTSYVAVTAKEGPSAAVGLYVTCFYIGGSAGAVLGGIAFHLSGWDGVVAVVVAMLAAMSAIVALVWK